MPALVGDPVAANTTTLKQTLDHEDLQFFAWIHPSEDLLPFLERWEDLIDGLKFHGPISQVAIEDRTVRPYLEFANDRGLPVLYHCGRNPISWADHLKLVAPIYPHVNFSVGHAGGAAMGRALITMKTWSALPENVYVETSTIRWPKLLRRMVETWGEEKVLYGSDLPFVDERVQWYVIMVAGLDDNEAFLGGNLQRLLKNR